MKAIRLSTYMGDFMCAIARGEPWFEVTNPREASTIHACRAYIWPLLSYASPDVGELKIAHQTDATMCNIQSRPHNLLHGTGGVVHFLR